jgi:hypothetical protein
MTHERRQDIIAEVFAQMRERQLLLVRQGGDIVWFVKDGAQPPDAALLAFVAEYKSLLLPYVKAATEVNLQGAKPWPPTPLRDGKHSCSHLTDVARNVVCLQCVRAARDQDRQFSRNSTKRRAQ